MLGFRMERKTEHGRIYPETFPLSFVLKPPEETKSVHPGGILGLYNETAMRHVKRHQHLTETLHNSNDEHERQSLETEIQMNQGYAIQKASEFAVLHNLEQIQKRRDETLGTCAYNANGERVVVMGHVPEGYVHVPPLLPTVEQRLAERRSEYYMRQYFNSEKHTRRVGRPSRYARKREIKYLSWISLIEKHTTKKIQKKRKARKLYWRRKRG